MRKSENDTFESVILESVKIKSIRVDRHPLYICQFVCIMYRYVAGNVRFIRSTKINYDYFSLNNTYFRIVYTNFSILK